MDTNSSEKEILLKEIPTIKKKNNKNIEHLPLNKQIEFQYQQLKKQQLKSH